MGRTLTTSGLMGMEILRSRVVSMLERGMGNAKNWMVQVRIAAEKTKDVGGSNREQEAMKDLHTSRKTAQMLQLEKMRGC